MNEKTTIIIMMVLSVLVSVTPVLFFTITNADMKVSSTVSAAFFWVIIGMVGYSACVGFYVGRRPKIKKEVT